MGRRKVRKIIGYFVILLFMVTVAGCQSVKKAFYINNESASVRQMKFDTRQAKLYRNLKTKAIVSVTLLDKQLMDKYFQAYRNSESLPKNHLKKRLMNKTTFFVRFYSPEEGFQNLDKKSPWQISFISNSRLFYADNIKRVKNVDWKYLFGQDSWSTGYIVTFDTGMRSGTVEISSVLGKLKFHFLPIAASSVFRQ